jgi:hypothetical protein
MSPSPAEQYEAREKRVEDAIRLQVPDRVPVACCQMMYYMTRVSGLSNRDAMVDHGRRLAAWKEVTQKLRLDLAPHAIVLPPAQPFSILGVKQFRWPGGGLPEDAPFQYVEAEYMKGDEYDAFLNDPGGFTVRRIWPRLASALEPLARLRPIHWYSNSRSLSHLLGPLLGTEPYVTLLRKMLEMGEASLDFMGKLFAYTVEMQELGFPMVYGSSADAPFDYLADQLRGTRGTMLDMFRRPEKILAAIDLLTPMSIESAVYLARRSNGTRVFMPLHRGAAGFMSDEQFRRFYWPGLRKVLEALVEAGLTPAPFFEGDYTPRLEYLAELPRGKIVGHFDRVDRKKAKKIIGDTICFWGNVPAGLLIAGTPDQVRDDVKELIDTFAGNGGLIVDGSMGIPDEARPENVEAMIDAVFTYGVNR